MVQVESVLGAKVGSELVRRLFVELEATPIISQDDDLLDVASAEAGVLLTADAESGFIHTIYMYGEEGQKGFSSFPGALPKGLEFSFDRDRVRATLVSAPDYAGSNYDTWDFPTYRLVVRYKGDRVSVVGLTMQR